MNCSTLSFRQPLRAIVGKRFSALAYLKQAQADNPLTNPPQQPIIRKIASERTTPKYVRRPVSKFQTPYVPPRMLGHDALWLRDACQCPRCVDPSTKQKLFQTSDLPIDVDFATIKESIADGTLTVTWSNDLEGFGDDHVSVYEKKFLDIYKDFESNYILSKSEERKSPVVWDQKAISEQVKFLDFGEYLSSDSVLYEALQQLSINGLLFIKGIPDKSTAVEEIGGRIGILKDTFYGRTWDVKSVPQAKNIAYTHQNLGFHMDLMYIADPPFLQMLHCLKNSCEGGASMFSDSFHAAEKLHAESWEEFDFLNSFPTQYTYDNDGEHYSFSRPTIEMHQYLNHRPEIKYVNWSPPFQAPFPFRHGTRDERSSVAFRKYLKSAKAFSKYIEAPESIFEYRLKEGECVIFNNRRVLHARRAFDITSGERWLKGAYIDNDVYRSKYHALWKKFDGPAALPE